MLVISNGNNTLLVSKGAYKALYEHQGYKVVSGAGASAPASEGDSLMRGIPEDEREGEELGSNSPESENGSSGHSVGEDDSSKNVEDEDDDEEEEEDEEEDLSEIPLSAMSMAQLKAYATEIGVKLDGTETKKELRQLIRENL